METVVEIIKGIGVLMAMFIAIYLGLVIFDTWDTCQKIARKLGIKEDEK